MGLGWEGSYGEVELVGRINMGETIYISPKNGTDAHVVCDLYILTNICRLAACLHFFIYFPHSGPAPISDSFHLEETFLWSL